MALTLRMSLRPRSRVLHTRYAAQACTCDVIDTELTGRWSWTFIVSWTVLCFGFQQLVLSDAVCVTVFRTAVEKASWVRSTLVASHW